MGGIRVTMDIFDICQRKNWVVDIFKFGFNVIVFMWLQSHCASVFFSCPGEGMISKNSSIPNWVNTLSDINKWVLVMSAVNSQYLKVVTAEQNFMFLPNTTAYISFKILYLIYERDLLEDSPNLTTILKFIWHEL